jgi:hypothetical protein
MISMPLMLLALGWCVALVLQQRPNGTRMTRMNTDFSSGNGRSVGYWRYRYWCVPGYQHLGFADFHRPRRPGCLLRHLSAK